MSNEKDADINSIIDNIVNSIVSIKQENIQLKKTQVSGAEVASLEMTVTRQNAEIVELRRKLENLMLENKRMVLEREEYLAKVNRLATVVKEDSVQEVGVRMKPSTEIPKMDMNIPNNIGQLPTDATRPQTNHQTSYQQPVTTPQTNHQQMVTPMQGGVPQPIASPPSHATQSFSQTPPQMPSESVSPRSVVMPPANIPPTIGKTQKPSSEFDSIFDDLGEDDPFATKEGMDDDEFFKSIQGK